MMEISFSSLSDHVVPMTDSSLYWRFTDERNNSLPEADLIRLRPLDKFAANFLSDYIKKAGLHRDCPFKDGFFNVIDTIVIDDDNLNEVKDWLFQRGPTKEQQVYLSWGSDTAMIVPFELLVKYFDDFAYPVSDDLSVFDEGLNWAMLFFHAGDIYFGSNKTFK